MWKKRKRKEKKMGVTWQWNIGQSLPTWWPKPLAKPWSLQCPKAMTIFLKLLLLFCYDFFSPVFLTNSLGCGMGWVGKSLIVWALHQQPESALNNGATTTLSHPIEVEPLRSTRGLVMLRSTGRFYALLGSSLFITAFLSTRRVCCLLHCIWRV